MTPSRSIFRGWCRSLVALVIGSLLAGQAIAGRKRAAIEPAAEAVAEGPTEAPSPMTHGGWEVAITATEAHAHHVLSGESVRLYGRDEGCDDQTYEARVLSFVGTFASFEVTEASACRGATPTHETRLQTVDLARGGSPVPLDQLFERMELRDRLGADRWLAERVGAVERCELDDVVQTARYAFEGLMVEQVRVTIAVPEVCEWERGNATRLSILLKPPSWLMKRLQRAEAGRTLSGSTR